MKRICFVLLAATMYLCSNAQNITTQLQNAFRQFENDPQLKAAIASLYVVNAKTGKVVFQHNAGIGLAPASTQKVITSVAAYELLGKDFRFESYIGYTGAIQNGKLIGDLILAGNGDPTLGSLRWKSTSPEAVLKRVQQALVRKGITSIEGDVSTPAGYFGRQSIPDGWIWQDIGNYFGAGHFNLNWRENQFDILLKSGQKIGEPVQIVGYKPKLNGVQYISEATSAAKGSGDNAYIYPFENRIRGTIPVGESRFTISGSITDPAAQLKNEIYESLQASGIKMIKAKTPVESGGWKMESTYRLYSEVSPSLDSIVYWLNRKSINLYAEALLNAVGFQKEKRGEWAKSIEIVKDFFKANGIDPIEMNIVDGSGLSPLNRVTTKAEVDVLLLAKKRSWFNGFYNSLPEYNGMKMKSGTINGVKAFTGYHTSKKGEEYAFSFIVNNYNGSSSSLVQKMYKLLDELK